MTEAATLMLSTKTNPSKAASSGNRYQNRVSGCSWNRYGPLVAQYAGLSEQSSR
jgi:hypothetical protein